MFVALALLLCAAAPSPPGATPAPAAAPATGAEKPGPEPSRDAAVAELTRQEATIREVYAIGRAGAVAALLKDLKESKTLKPHPLLVARAYKIEQWVSEAEQLRKDADAALAAKEYDRAKELYQKLAAHPLVANAVGTSLKKDLDQLVEQASPGWARRFAVGTGGILAAIWKWEPLRNTVHVVAYIALGAIALTQVYGRWRARRARKSTLTEFRLLDATETGTGGASETLAARFNAILLEVAHRPGRLSGLDGQLGEALAWASAEPLPGLQELAEHLTGSITVGPVSVPTKALGALLARWAGTARYRLEGVVVRTKDATRVILSRRDLAIDKVEKSWMAEAAGTDTAALNDAFRELAYHLAFDRLGKSSPTTDVRAFVAYRQALDLSDQATSADRRLAVLEEMRSKLATAVARDPALAQAKLALASVLWSLRQRETARALLAEIDVSREPTLAAEVRVHRALLDIQSEREDLIQRAFHDLAEVTAARADRIGTNARAFRLAAGAELIAAWRAEGDHQREDENEVTEVTEALEKHFLTTLSPPPDMAIADWTAAKGYALCAAGRLHLERGAREKGISLLERSVVVAPNYAPAHVALARAYRRAKADSWPEAALRELAQAALLDPSSPDVHEELGRVHLERKPPHREKAAEHFSKAADQHASARFEWGKLLCDPLGKVEEGLLRMREAIDMAGSASPPYYAVALHRCALEGAGEVRERARRTATGEGKAVPANDPAELLIQQAEEAEEWLSKLTGSVEKSLKAAEGRHARSLQSLAQKARKFLGECQERRARFPPWPPPPA